MSRKRRKTTQLLLPMIQESCKTKVVLQNLHIISRRSNFHDTAYGPASHRRAHCSEARGPHNGSAPMRKDDRMPGNREEAWIRLCLAGGACSSQGCERGSGVLPVGSPGPGDNRRGAIRPGAIRFDRSLRGQDEGRRQRSRRDVHPDGESGIQPHGRGHPIDGGPRVHHRDVAAEPERDP